MLKTSTKTIMFKKAASPTIEQYRIPFFREKQKYELLL